MTRLINIYLALNMLVLPVYAQTSCAIVDEVEYGRISDTSGKSLMTEIVRTRECTSVLETQGDCIRWEDVNITFDLNTSYEVEIIAEDYSDSLGSILSIMSVSSQIDNVFSGWKGYCVKGTETDFSAFEDPMFWAGIAMSFVGASGVTGGISEGVSSGLTDTLGTYAAEYVGNFAECAVMSSVDIADATMDAMTTEGEPACDPIDEFCDADNSSSEADYFTMKRNEYDSLLASDPDLASYIQIVDQPMGVISPQDILTVRLKPLSEDDVAGLDEEEYAALQDKMKKKQAEMKAAIIAMQLAACTVSGSAASGASTSTNGDMTMDASSLGVMALSMINPLLGAAASVVLALVDSFKDINSCGNQGDAEAKGERHVKTHDSLMINGICRPTFEECLQDKPTGGGCWRTGYNYCCFDQPVSRFLMEQMKAQLGKDWAHCSDMNLKEISVVNFRSCTEADKTSGIDGGPVTATEGRGLIAAGGYASYYDMAQGEFYQAKQKCLNYDDLTEYIVNEFGGKISTDQIMQHINNLNSADSIYKE